MRISDWSSDVCSSDLQSVKFAGRVTGHRLFRSNKATAFQDLSREVLSAANNSTADNPKASARLSKVARVGLPCPLTMYEICDAETPERSDNSTRPDEHTSVIQSLMRLQYAGFCLNKKNQKYT